VEGAEEAAEVVLGDGPPEGGDGGAESRAGALDGGQREEGAAVGVGDPAGGAGLGRVDGDDAEVLGPDGLGARGREAVGLAEVLTPVGAAAPSSRAGLHGWDLRMRLGWTRSQHGGPPVGAAEKSF